MTANLYRLKSTVVAGGDVFTLRDPKHRIASFFIWDTGNGRSLRYATPTAEAQSRIWLRDVLEADYLDVTPGVPLFSTKARAVLSEALPDEVRFYECTVRCQGQELPFHLGKVLVHRPLVDTERSRFRTLGEGEQVLSGAVYRTTVEQDFAIARDTDFRERLVVSQRFVDICHDTGLNVDFAEPV